MYMFIDMHVHVHAYLIFIGQCQVFDLHLLPPPPREKYLPNTISIYCVNDGYGAPISAHPQEVLPNGKACDSEELAVVGDWNLHLRE